MFRAARIPGSMGRRSRPRGRGTQQRSPPTSQDADRLLLQATGRTSLDDALEWIAADNALVRGSNPQSLLRAIASLPRRNGAREAARRLARRLTASELDTAAVLLEPNTI